MRGPNASGQSINPSERGFSKGLAAAIAVALVGLAVVGFFVLTAPEREGGLIEDDTEAPLDLIELGNEGQGMSIQLTDKDDPNRLAGIIEAKSFEPQGPNERLVEEPRAWIFFRDGRSAYVEAAHGRFVMPSPNAAPESGMLRGTETEPVRLRLYEARADGLRPDPMLVPPAMTATFDEPLQFDFRHARVSTTGAFEISSPELFFSGSYLTAVINQVRERLEVLEVRRGDRLYYTPLPEDERNQLRARQGIAAKETDEGTTTETTRESLAEAAVADEPAPDPVTSDASSEVASARAAETSPADEPGSFAQDIATAVEHYRVVMLDQVRVTQGVRVLTADRLDMWARFTDNQLAPDAIAPLEFASVDGDARSAPTHTGSDHAQASRTGPSQTSPTRTAARPESNDQPDADVAATPNAPSEPAHADNPFPPPAVGPDTIVLDWSGSMLVTPLGEAAPEELGDEELALRFTAERSGFVRFEDPDAGAVGRSAALDYGLTSGLLALGSPGGTGSLAVEGAGELISSRVEANLVDGVVTIPGPGQLAGEGDDDARARLRWQNRADFVFLRDAEGRVAGGLDTATLIGNVRGSQAEATFTADQLVAAFTPPTDDRPQRLDIIDLTFGEASDGRGAQLRGETVVVEFADGTLGNDIDVRRVTARGNAVASRPGESLTSDFLTATLSRRYDGDLAVDHVSASGELVFAGRDGLLARADSMTGDGLSQVVTLEGVPASVTQRGSVLTGETIIVDGRQRRARVPGAGTFAHDPDARGPAGTNPPADADTIDPASAPILASWTRSMTFDDVTGRIDCTGEASVISRAREDTTDTLLAEHLVVEITPYTEESASASGDDAERVLQRATAFGSPDAPAKVESRVYDRTDPERVLQLFYLEGDEVIADAEREQLIVPTAGRLLVLDRRDPEADPSSAGDQPLGADGPALSRFSWTNRMTFDRLAGEAVMRGDVDAASKDLATGRTSVLRAQRLAARFQEIDERGNPVEPTPGAADGVRGRLTIAEAFNSVYFASGEGREMTADRLLYDAIRGVATATAAPGRSVTVLDTARGTTTSSAALLWDLTQDRVEVVRPSPIVTPR